MQEGVCGRRPGLDGGREGVCGGGDPAIPIFNGKFSDCRLFPPHSSSYPLIKESVPTLHEQRRANLSSYINWLGSCASIAIEKPAKKPVVLVSEKRNPNEGDLNPSSTPAHYECPGSPKQNSDPPNLGLGTSVCGASQPKS